MTDMITTDRLILRRFTDADVPVVAAAMQDPNVIGKLLWIPSPYGTAEACDFVTNIAIPDPGTFAITHKGDLIGSISVGTRLGYWLVPDAWGRGVAFEAAYAVLNWHFSRRQAPISAGYVEDHPRSRRILEKLGFRDCDQRQEYSAPLGRSVAFQDMSLSHAGWKESA